MPDRLTIVVPTYNRYPLLERLLRYYRSCGAPFPMQVLDSSRDARPSDAAWRELRSAPWLTVAEYEAATPPTLKIRDGVRRVATPYVVLWADDDLMVPAAIGRAVEFLEAHPDFSVAHGRCGLFRLAEGSDRPSMVSVSPAPQRSVIAGTAAGRLLEFLCGATNLFYSVHRTLKLQENLERCCAGGWGEADAHAAFPRTDLWVELVLACLDVIQGKAKELDTLYLMRDAHPGMNSWVSEADRLDLFDWVAEPRFARACEAFTACLADPLARQDGVTPPAAREAVKQAFWAWLAGALSRGWHGAYSPERVSLAERLWRKARRVVQGSGWSGDRRALGAIVAALTEPPTHGD